MTTLIIGIKQIVQFVVGPMKSGLGLKLRNLYFLAKPQITNRLSQSSILWALSKKMAVYLLSYERLGLGYPA